MRQDHYTYFQFIRQLKRWGGRSKRIHFMFERQEVYEQLGLSAKCRVLAILRYKLPRYADEVLTNRNVSTSSRCSTRSFFFDAYRKDAAATLAMEGVAGWRGAVEGRSSSVSLPSGDSSTWWARFPSTGSGGGLDLFIASSTACSAGERKYWAPSLRSGRWGCEAGVSEAVLDPTSGEGDEILVGVIAGMMNENLYNFESWNQGYICESDSILKGDSDYRWLGLKGTLKYKCVLMILRWSCSDSDIY